MFTIVDNFASEACEALMHRPRYVTLRLTPRASPVRVSPARRWTQTHGNPRDERSAMRTIDIHEVKVHLFQLVAQAARGESFLIAASGRPRVMVIPVDALEAGGVRRLGSPGAGLSAAEGVDPQGAGRYREALGRVMKLPDGGSEQSHRHVSMKRGGGSRRKKSELSMAERRPLERPW